MSYLCRLRVNCVGVFDVLTFDNSQTNHLALMPQYQVPSIILTACGHVYRKTHHTIVVQYVQNGECHISHILGLNLRMGS